MAAKIIKKLSSDVLTSKSQFPAQTKSLSINDISKEAGITKSAASPRIQDIRMHLKRFCEHWCALDRENFTAAYNAALTDAKHMEYDSKDISAFCSEIGKSIPIGPKSNTAGLGIFLSALVNASKENDFEMPFDNVKIDYLGYKNKKNIVVHGDVGEYACFKGTAKGRMAIYGSAISLDYLDCKELIIYDGVSDHCSHVNMGKVTIHGNCGFVFASGSKSSITIDGNLDYASHIHGILRVNGNIYHMDEPEIISIVAKAIYQYDRVLVKNGEVIGQPINIERPSA